MTWHLILAYGRETEHRRAILAVLSFWAWYEGDRSAVQTVVFTDHPEVFAPYFAGLPVTYRLLTPEGLIQMRGPQDFVHRVKLCIIRQIAREYPADSLLYCDSDTFFAAPAAPLLHHLQPGTSIMHQREHPLAEAIPVWASFIPQQDALPRKLVALLESRSFELGGTSYRFSQEAFMWNAGVLGLSPETTVFLLDIVAFNDDLYEASKWILAEQVAFSLALQARTRLVASDRYVFHYWSQGQKTTVDGLLADLARLLPPTLDLPARLARTQTLTATLLRAVKAEDARQVSHQAFKNGQLLAGVKQAAKAFFIKRLRFGG